jgi:hypothetical protein
MPGFIVWLRARLRRPAVGRVLCAEYARRKLGR